MKNKIKVARVATVPFFIDNQLRKQMEQLIGIGFDVTAVSSYGDWGRLEKIIGLKCIKVNIARVPSLFKDIISVYELFRLFKRSGFDIVHSTTPKAGLVCAIACRLAGTSISLHTFTGQTWATKRGVSRSFLKWVDRLILTFMTQCYADSESQRQFLISEGVGDKQRIKVLGQGSLAGVDFERFDRNLWKIKAKKLKSELGIGENDFVLIFVGRLTREKGVLELLNAYQMLREKYDQIHLIMVGPLEDFQLEENAKLPNVHFVGETKIPEKYLAISNLLCLPSYREGFGTVVIEAAAMEVPAVGSDITGLRDAIHNQETGILVEPMDITALMCEIEALIINKLRCNELGKKAYARCLEYFEAKKVSELVANEYLEQIKR